MMRLGLDPDVRHEPWFERVFFECLMPLRAMRDFPLKDYELVEFWNRPASWPHLELCLMLCMRRESGHAGIVWRAVQRDHEMRN